MKTAPRLCFAIFLSLLAFLPSAALAESLVVASCGTVPATLVAGSVRYDTVDTNGNKCVAGTFTPSGTQNVNIMQILGAAPSLTNPLWVFPGTGATFTVAGAGTAGAPGTAVLAVQGVASGTPVPVSGTVTIAEPSTTNAVSSALAANQVINAAASSLYSFNVSADSTLSAAAWWIMIYNATSAPVDGAVTPARCYAMPAGYTGYSAAFPVGLPFSTGITIGVSTTGCFTKTASTHAFISGDYK